MGQIEIRFAENIVLLGSTSIEICTEHFPQPTAVSLRAVKAAVSAQQFSILPLQGPKCGIVRHSVTERTSLIGVGGRQCITVLGLNCWLYADNFIVNDRLVVPPGDNFVFS